MKHYQQGAASKLVIIGVVIIGLFVFVSLTTQLDESPEGGNADVGVANNVCPTKCAFFLQQTCGQGANNRVVGVCVIPWSCTFSFTAACELE